MQKFVFSCQTASGVPQPLDSLGFGRKQAPDAHFALDSVFCPEKHAELVTTCHRFVAALFWAEKVRKSGQVPEFPRTSFFTGFSVFRPRKRGRLRGFGLKARPRLRSKLPILRENPSGRCGRNFRRSVPKFSSVRRYHDLDPGT